MDMLLRFLSSRTPLLSATSFPKSKFSSLTVDHFTRSRFSVGAVDKESEFEVDREKARQALQQLDEQLQTLSQKEVTPRKRPSSSYLDPDLERQLKMGLRSNEMPEISGSYLKYSALALVILTILNNIVFNLVVKPAVDGEEPTPTTIRREPMKEAAVQQAMAPPLVDLR